MAVDSADDCNLENEGIGGLVRSEIGPFFSERLKFNMKTFLRRQISILS